VSHFSHYGCPERHASYRGTAYILEPCMIRRRRAANSRTFARKCNAARWLFIDHLSASLTESSIFASRNTIVKPSFTDNTLQSNNLGQESSPYPRPCTCSRSCILLSKHQCRAKSSSHALHTQGHRFRPHMPQSHFARSSRTAMYAVPSEQGSLLMDDPN
jgi:hypothetical protein